MLILGTENGTSLLATQHKCIQTLWKSLIIFAKEAQIEKFKKQKEKTKNERQKLDEINEQLQGEVDSLSTMLEEMAKTDVSTWSKIAKDLKTDTVTKALMITGKKAEA